MTHILLKCVTQKLGLTKTSEASKALEIFLLSTSRTGKQRQIYYVVILYRVMLFTSYNITYLGNALIWSTLSNK